MPWSKCACAPAISSFSSARSANRAFISQSRSATRSIRKRISSMSLLLANVLSTLMALASLGALIVVGRKANETIKLGKVLALRVAAASNGLERAVKAIQSERTDLTDENNKLGARLAETQRVRREMEEAIEELNRLRKALTRDIRHARNVADSARSEDRIATATEQALPKEKNALPVFVRRAVRKATVNLAGQACARTIRKTTCSRN